MRIETYYREQITLSDFADKHNLILEIHERLPQNMRGGDRFFAFFSHCEVKENNCLISVHGNGSTPDKAIFDYTTEISGKLLVVRARTEERCEIKTPLLTYQGE